MSFFVSIGVVLYFSITLIAFSAIDQLRNLIRMIIEVLKGMRAFLIIIITYLIAFAVVFYQSRRAMSDDSPEDSVDEGSFANDLMEMFYLIFTGGDSTNYSGVMIPFYLLVVVFQCLVLLNLIISIIGETYGQVKEDFDIIDLKERINMLLEIAEEAAVIKTVAKKISCKKRRVRWFQRRALVNEKPEINLDDKLLLVVEKFEGKSDSDVSIKDVDDRLKEMRKEMRKELNSEVDTLKYEIGSLKKEMNRKLEDEMASLKREMTSEIGKCLKGEISSTQAQIVNDLRVIIQDMFSEVAEVKLKK